MRSDKYIASPLTVASIYNYVCTVLFKKVWGLSGGRNKNHKYLLSQVCLDFTYCTEARWDIQYLNFELSESVESSHSTSDTKRKERNEKKS